MKFILMHLFFYLLTITASAQDCKVSLNTGDREVDAQSKPIQFVIEIKDTLLRSNSEGILILEKKYFEKVKNAHVLSFKFFNQLDLEYFREPMFTRTKRTIQNYCDKTLVAEKRW